MHSVLAKDFIKRLLNANPKKRLSAKKALLHPWILQSTSKDKLKKDSNFDKWYDHKRKSSYYICNLVFESNNLL